MTAPRTVLVTGATDGIGRRLVEQLAGHGHQVVVHGRHRSRVDVVAAELRGRTGTPVSTVVADLARLDDVRRLADQVRAEVPTLDTVVNNAGTVHHGPPTRTVDGHEPAWAVNYLAPYLLTRLLLPSLVAAPGQARVVNVSSNTHAFQPLHPDPDSLHGWPAYAHSKLALVMFGHALARRVRPEYLAVHAVDPGSVPTKLSDGVGARHAAHAAAALARTVTAASPQRQGSYWVNGEPALSSAEARDTTAQDRLWRDTATRFGLPEHLPHLVQAPDTTTAVAQDRGIS